MLLKISLTNGGEMKVGYQRWYYNVLKLYGFKDRYRLFSKIMKITKGETITRVNGDVSINCSKRLQIEKRLTVGPYQCLSEIKFSKIKLVFFFLNFIFIKQNTVFVQIQT
jgi:hypothetical protein